MNTATAHGGEDTGWEAWGARAWGLIVGVALVLVPMLVRLQTPLDLLPYWDGDPFTQEASVIGLTPGLSLYGDVVSLIGAAVLLALAPRRGRIATLAGAVMVAAGAAACAWHLSLHAFNAKEAITSGAWISGVAGAFALWRVAGDRRVRLLVFALIIGAVGLLAAKGAYQVAVEHPATVEAFQRDREAILARNGWSPDSSMAKAYERRLMQTEATGWFGFANVYASFAAAGVAAFGVLAAGAWLTWRSARADEEGEPGRWPFVLSGAGFVLSAAALAMAGAKGGFAAVLLGVGVALALEWARRRNAGRAVWLRLIGPAAIAAPLLAVIARGAVDERMGELSLLFRWFYMQGAARIFGANWLQGVGPDGFQAAYSLAKNPLSPEDVTSPHSLLWDWAACLGIGGLAWGALLLWMSTRLGSGAVAEESASEAGDDHADETRKLMRAVCLIAALSAVLSIPTQYAAMLPEEALGVRIGGLVVWCVCSCAVLAVAQRCIGWRIALAAGACVLLTHTQIEITGVWPQSCGLLLAVVAVAAVPNGCRADADEGEPTSRAAGRWPQYVCAAIVLWIGLVALRTAGVARQWESSLADAYTLATPVRELRRQIAGAASDPSEQARLTHR
ncbi:MAG: O-antigen ligase family protein, partial [Phycisphaerales bacterium]|nr:O-antigen ligase family protein [Phycisphaerales bacterium]